MVSPTQFESFVQVHVNNLTSQVLILGTFMECYQSKPAEKACESTKAGSGNSIKTMATETLNLTTIM